MVATAVTSLAVLAGCNGSPAPSPRATPVTTPPPGPMPTFDLCKALSEDFLSKQGLTATLTIPRGENELGMDRNGCVIGKGEEPSRLLFGFYVTDRNVEYMKAISAELPFRETTIDGRVTGILGPSKIGECKALSNLSGGGGILISGQFVKDPCEKVVEMADTLLPLMPR
ncbi:DUF3558 family protein [Nocardia sp. CDC159]|uniref:DUF3558 family protein n=1 Tax=Nocardia pulmonis TaxID=2951408 RepID=A0A9X2IZL2_9NOCA|nr:MULTISPECIES: DUF3558 family protein [Nocardia]MCM6778192.1 DUF3558 family protein [Nocardia pulmonis]MCM6791081.1 DUF3558 family protein [Nocardia sp. CDC159]